MSSREEGGVCVWLPRAVASQAVCKPAATPCPGSVCALDRGCELPCHYCWSRQLATHDSPAAVRDDDPRSSQDSAAHHDTHAHQRPRTRCPAALTPTQPGNTASADLTTESSISPATTDTLSTAFSFRKCTLITSFKQQTGNTGRRPRTSNSGIVTSNSLYSTTPM